MKPKPEDEVEPGPWTEIEIHAYNIRKLSKEAAEKIKDKIVDELRAEIWDGQDEYDRDEEEEFAEFDIFSFVKVYD